MIRYNYKRKDSTMETTTQTPAQQGGPTYIEVRYTWRDLLPSMLAVMADGTPEGRQKIYGELCRMADAADRYNNLCTPDGEVQI